MALCQDDDSKCFMLSVFLFYIDVYVVVHIFFGLKNSFTPV